VVEAVGLRSLTGSFDHQGGIVVRGRELAVTGMDEAHPGAAVVGGAVLGHGAVIDHD
jgi:hypothetical protein